MGISCGQRMKLEIIQSVNQFTGTQKRGHLSRHVRRCPFLKGILCQEIFLSPGKMISQESSGLSQATKGSCGCSAVVVSGQSSASSLGSQLACALGEAVFLQPES